MDFQPLNQALFGVDNIYDLQSVAAQIGEPPPEQIACIAVFYVVHVAAGLFALKTLTTLLLRQFGLSHPRHYSRWPRLPWRVPYRAWLSFRRWYERVFLVGKRGATGGFTGVLATLTLLFKSGHILLGRASAFDIGLMQPVGIKPQRHIFTYAQTGSGKTTMLVSAIASWLGSVLLIDPKAQVMMALREKDKRQWLNLDPYGISGAAKSACINFFDCIKEAIARDGNDAAVLWALRIAEALIVTASGSRTPYFTDVARQFLAGLILHVLTTFEEQGHNLPFVRDLIVHGYRVFNDDGTEETTEDEAQALLLRAMARNPAFDGAISGAAAALKSASGETSGNVRSTLQEQTKWLDIPQVRAILCETTIPLSALKTRDDVVLAFSAPIYSIREELSPFCRLLTNMTAYTFEAVKQKKGVCLFVCDELPSQGSNPTTDVILAVGRGHSLLFWGIAQNVELMQQFAPKSWKSFSGEADVTLWMGCTHPDSRAHLSAALGKKTIVEKDPQSGRKSYREVPTMDADQIGRYLDPNSDNLIVTRAGARALRLKNEPYFKALPVWAYAPDPDHREALLRRFTRWFLSLFTQKPKGGCHVEKAKDINEASQIPDTHERSCESGGQTTAAVAACEGASDEPEPVEHQPASAANDPHFGEGS